MSTPLYLSSYDITINAYIVYPQGTANRLYICATQAEADDKAAQLNNAAGS